MITLVLRQFFAYFFVIDSKVVVIMVVIKKISLMSFPVLFSFLFSLNRHFYVLQISTQCTQSYSSNLIVNVSTWTGLFSTDLLHFHSANISLLISSSLMHDFSANFSSIYSISSLSHHIPSRHFRETRWVARFEKNLKFTTTTFAEVWTIDPQVQVRSNKTN
jgi:hypothetical protein